jgi:hypothetical protein
MSKSMWMITALALVAAGVVAAQPRPSIDPKADDILRRMSGYLASLQSFRVASTSVDELVLPDGQKVQSVAESLVAVKRPNRLRSDRVGPLADAEFRYDGSTFSIYGKRLNLYASAAAPPTLDAAIDAARDRFGLYAPGGDLLFSDPYGVLMQDTTQGRYVGLDPIDGVPCHHLAFRGREVDWQIWIEDGPEPLPLRYVITSKNDFGQPEFQVRLSRWEPHAVIADQTFVFVPPPGSARIELLPQQYRRAAR